LKKIKMSKKENEITPSLIHGKWKNIEANNYTNVYNPATEEIISRTPMCGLKEVDEAVSSSVKALEVWSNLPYSKRAEVMFNYRELIKQNKQLISEIISTENGKTLSEAMGDIQRGFEVVDFACGISHLAKGESLSEIDQNIDLKSHLEPIGVCAGISPFNFPAMVPMWMFPLAIACGNTFILKPSEKVPLTAIKLAELFQEAGLPDGVLNIVHGGKEVVDALCIHPKISAISFVGSSHIAKHVYSLGSKHGKRVQAGGAAKNALVIMPDAEPISTMNAIMRSAYGCAGQRCMAGSLLVGVGDNIETLKEMVTDRIDKLVVGDPIKNKKTEMGPVIDSNSKKRIYGIIDGLNKTKAKILRDGRESAYEKGFFVGPTLVDNVDASQDIFSQEIFGPVLSILNPKKIEHAVETLNKLNYGNGASIFTSSGSAARYFSKNIKCGMVGINVGVPAPMSIFPFSGWNDSFYGDLHMQGREGVQFYTRQKVILSRWDNLHEYKSGW
jgi:malonate-semialdehyde dehydrogenase (acetylating)/methylmalonate-semialdehyde dehydrogenase